MSTHRMTALPSEKQITQALRPFSQVAACYRHMLARQTRKWVEQSGFDWCKTRANTLVEYLIKVRANEQTEPLSWYSPKYVVYAERIARSGKDAQFIQLIQCWRVYTLLGKAKVKLSDADVEKFVTAVHGSSPDTSRWRNKPQVRGRSAELGLIDYNQLLTSIGFTTNWPGRNDLKWRRSLFRVWTNVGPLQSPTHIPNLLALDGRLLEEWIAGINYVPQVSRGGRTLPKPHVLRVYDGMPDNVMLNQHRPDGTAGNVHYRIQSDGKARFFCAPQYWVQYLLEPYAKELYRKLRSISQDCTFDQNAGVRKVTEWINSGVTCHSIDLSSATDRFPLAFTYDFLDGISTAPNQRMWASAFAHLSRLPFGFRGEGLPVGTPWVRWNVGQPLGLNASFAAFALSHHALVQLAFAPVIGEIRGDLPYVILGDDIVIAHDTAAENYRRLLRGLGVAVSEHKSVSSDSLGEFAGRVILRDDFGFKLKHTRADYRTLLSLIENIGPKAIRLLPKSTLRDVIALIPSGVHPGYNPGGFPREKVLAFYGEYFNRKDLIPDLSSPAETTESGTRARAEFFSSQSYRIHSNLALPLPPRGGRTFDQYGSPLPGPQKGRRSSSWKFRAYRSRSWVNRVRKCAVHAGLLNK